MKLRILTHPASLIGLFCLLGFACGFTEFRAFVFFFNKRLPDFLFAFCAWLFSFVAPVFVIALAFVMGLVINHILERHAPGLYKQIKF